MISKQLHNIRPHPILIVPSLDIVVCRPLAVTSRLPPTRLRVLPVGDVALSYAVAVMVGGAGGVVSAVSSKTTVTVKLAVAVFPA